MSIHPSLSSSSKSSKMRSVLKRAERLKSLMEKDAWKEGKSIFGLPKTKITRIKLKKEKAAPAAASAAAGEAEAQVIKGLLESNGIRCLLKSNAAPSVHVFTVDGMGEFKVMVEESLAEGARGLIKEE